MIYRVDNFIENNINPINDSEYDSLWMILTLSSDIDTPMLVGANNGCAYTIKINKQLHDDWKMAVGDFIGYCDVNNLNGIVAITEDEYTECLTYYAGHSYNETVLRDYESPVLVHSTSMENWLQIQKDGMLKSWNKLNIPEKEPIGKQLGDPVHFSEYIMFGGGVSGEIVVNSKQSGKIVMDIDTEYKTGARLYFDAEKIAKDGLLIRDGAHVKVKDCLSLKQYLLWTATWDKVGLESQLSTPRKFSELSDEKFENIKHYGLCHICGKYSKLSFEHIPPENAMNSGSATIYTGDNVMKRYRGEKAKYINQQQGMGKHTLCEKCNNNTGSWYVPTYNDVAKDVASYLHKTEQLVHGDIISLSFKNVPVLSFVKQVITMFCSLLTPLEVKRLGFDSFLLHKENNEINTKLFDIHIYLTSKSVGQLMIGPTTAFFKTDSGIDTQLVSDLCVYPFGFILNLTPEKPIKYGTSITPLLDTEYNKNYNFTIPLQYLERKSDLLPLPLVFKPIPEGQYKEEKQ